MNIFLYMSIVYIDNYMIYNISTISKGRINMQDAVIT